MLFWNKEIGSTSPSINGSIRTRNEAETYKLYQELQTNFEDYHDTTLLKEKANKLLTIVASENGPYFKGMSYLIKAKLEQEKDILLFSKYSKKASDIFIKVGAYNESADALLGLGFILNKSGQHELSLNQFNKANELIKDTFSILHYKYLRYMGIYYAKVNRRGVSQTYFAKAYDLALKLEDSSKLAEILISSLIHGHSRIRNSLTLDLANSYIDSSKTPVQYLRLLLYKAKILYESKQILQSKLLFNRAKKLAIEKGRVSDYKTSLNGLAATYFSEGNYKEALKIYTQLIDQETNSYYLQAFYRNTADIYTILGDSGNGYLYLQASMYLQDSLYGPEVLQKVDAVRLEHEEQLDKAEAQTQLLKDRNQLRQRTLLSIIAALGILIAIVAALAKRRQRITMEKLRRQEIKLSEGKLKQVEVQHQSKVMEAIIEGQEDERARIAADLHDSLGALLASVKLHYENECQNGLNGAKLGRAGELLSQACNEVRRISHGMKSQLLAEYGLVAALEDLKMSMPGTGIDISLSIFNMDIRLDEIVEISMFRICQELVANAIKHGKATQIHIDLVRHDDQVVLIVDDNGTGFHVDKLLEKTGIGITNINNRASRIKATFTLDSMIGRGTTAILTVPYSFNADPPIKNTPSIIEPHLP